MALLAHFDDWGCAYAVFALMHRRFRDYAQVAFAAASVVFSLSMIPDVFMRNVVDWVSGNLVGVIPFDWQISWVSSSV